MSKLKSVSQAVGESLGLGLTKIHKGVTEEAACATPCQRLHAICPCAAKKSRKRSVPRDGHQRQSGLVDITLSPTKVWIILQHTTTIYNSTTYYRPLFPQRDTPIHPPPPLERLELCTDAADEILVSCVCGENDRHTAGKGLHSNQICASFATVGEQGSVDPLSQN